MPVFNEYNYKPLSERDVIRLLILDPSTSETAPLSCQIIEYQLSAGNLDYSAVSYCWGKRQFSKIIQIGCDGDVRYLRITPNAEIVLKGLRAHYKPQYLWIDAICINQNDEAEKAQQIPMMGDIYNKALAVDIWLGPGDHMTARILGFLRRLGRVPEVTKWKTQSKMAGRIAFLMGKYLHEDGIEGIRSLLAFFDQPWFSRRWIIQEACLAKRGVVHCGRQSIDLHLLGQAMVRFQRMDISNYAFKVAANLGHLAASFSMLELLWHFHDSSCIESKDRIAAFLGLAQDGQHLCLNYAEPWVDYFEEFASFTYNVGCNDTRLQLLLHLFEFGSLSKAEDPSLPSWVPDWSKSRQRRLPYFSGPKSLDTYEPYPSSPGHSGKATVAYHDGRLQIYGSALGVRPYSLRVAYTATLHSFQQGEVLEEQQACDVAKRLFPWTHATGFHIEAFIILLRTVSLFRHPEEKRERTSKSLGRFEKSLRRSLPGLDHRELLTWLRTLDSVLRDFCVVELRPSGPNLVPVHGYGISPELTLVDDICIPLWNSQPDDPQYSFQTGRFDTIVQLATLLVVRRNGIKIKHGLDEARLFEECRIVGPMICITWTQAYRDSGCLPSSEQDPIADILIR
nr:heterokaryon incompatibility protein 6, or allele [Quercus suber]